MLTLGLNAFHGDAAACILQDGQLMAAAEEERFSRVKHAAGFPVEAISYCLSFVGAEIEDLDIIAVNTNPKARLMQKLAYTLKHRPSLDYMMERLRHRRERTNLRDHFERTVGSLNARTRIRHIEHHRSHLASTYYFSPFDRAAVLSLDGFGDFCSSAWGVGKGVELRMHDEVLFPHSLGIFYQAITQYLGFPNYGDEYKVMGLSPYGRPKYMGEMNYLIRPDGENKFLLGLEYFRHHRDKMNFRWEHGAPVFEPLYSADLEALLGPARQADSELTQRHKDIACSAQAQFELIFFHLLNFLQRSTEEENLCLAGGCAMNSVAVGKIKQRESFKRVFVQPGAGDAGGALGAAVCAELTVNGRLMPQPMRTAQWGPEFDDTYIGQLLEARKAEFLTVDIQYSYIRDLNELCGRAAAAIAAGKIVGWFQGRMEWGPRALGQRSILADPRRSDMKQILNEKIKLRESFRPFAPSILREAVDEWFETDDDVPFMTKVFRIRAEKRSQIPAVTHVDGSGRLQTVSEESDTRYYGLIKEFASLTDVPIVLNTSFNENEPIVCRPEEAIECFLRTKMDCLVLNHYLIWRSATRLHQTNVPFDKEI